MQKTPSRIVRAVTKKLWERDQREMRALNRLFAPIGTKRSTRKRTRRSKKSRTPQH